MSELGDKLLALAVESVGGQALIEAAQIDAAYRFAQLP